MPKKDQFFNDVVYWTNKLDEAREKWTKFKEKTNYSDTLNYEATFELNEICLNFYAASANLAAAVRTEQKYRQNKKPLWKRLLRK